MNTPALTREQAKLHQSRLLQILIDHDMPVECLEAIGTTAHWLSQLVMSDALPSKPSSGDEGRAHV